MGLVALFLLDILIFKKSDDKNRVKSQKINKNRGWAAIFADFSRFLSLDFAKNQAI